MGYDNDPNRDEDGEPLIDFDDEYQSDQEPQGYDQLFVQDLEDEDDDDAWRRRDRSPTPDHNESDSKSKPRKRLVKKSAAADSAPDFGMTADYEDDPASFVRDVSDSDNPASSGGGNGKRKKFVLKDKKRDKKLKVDRREKSGGDRSKFKVKKSSGGRSRDRDGDLEVKEMWDTIAGGNSEDDQEGVRMVDDDNLVDDSGVDPADRYGSDNEPYSPGDAPQAEEGEEDDEIKQLFKMGKKKKKGLAFTLEFIESDSLEMAGDNQSAKGKDSVKERVVPTKEMLNQMKAAKKRGLEEPFPPMEKRRKKVEFAGDTRPPKVPQSKDKDPTAQDPPLVIMSEAEWVKASSTSYVLDWDVRQCDTMTSPITAERISKGIILPGDAGMLKKFSTQEAGRKAIEGIIQGANLVETMLAQEGEHEKRIKEWHGHYNTKVGQLKELAATLKNTQDSLIDREASLNWYKGRLSQVESDLKAERETRYDKRLQLEKRIIELEKATHFPTELKAQGVVELKASQAFEDMFLVKAYDYIQQGFNMAILQVHEAYPNIDVDRFVFDDGTDSLLTTPDVEV